ncbi:hypothetical protein VITFI_CDS0860 [Vitreoscilla filiformis]|uniref:CheW-like domain-containing protein n=1 Tax=Vitreoscilla filiformis TaxID=63 RepID=A0A221KC84_VITFI|nr:hypothetical protein VITFI_CDS0860 [Vitreoscilla filiformis]
MPRILSLPCGPWRLGVAYAWACTVVKASALAKVPCAPPWVLGMANWEGEIVPVVDVACWLGLPSEGAVHRHWLVGGDEGARLALSWAGRPASWVWAATSRDPGLLSALPAALQPLVQAAWRDEAGQGWAVLDGARLFEVLHTELTLFCALPGTVLRS